jgi:hypothetical protein
LYKNDQRTLRRRRALRRLVKSPAKAKLRPTAADHTGDPLPSQGAHRWCILDDTPVGSASVVRTIHAPLPMLPSTLASQPCCKAQQQGLGFLSTHPCYCPGSLACSTVDSPFNDTLVALQASFSFWCSNRGPLVELISN